MFTHSFSLSYFFLNKSNLEEAPGTNSPCHSRQTTEAVSESPRRKEGDLIPCFQHITITFAHVCRTFTHMQGLFAARLWALRCPKSRSQQENVLPILITWRAWVFWATGMQINKPILWICAPYEFLKFQEVLFLFMFTFGICAMWTRMFQHFLKTRNKTQTNQN